MSRNRESKLYLEHKKNKTEVQNIDLWLGALSTIADYKDAEEWKALIIKTIEMEMDIIRMVDVPPPGVEYSGSNYKIRKKRREAQIENLRKLKIQIQKTDLISMDTGNEVSYV